MLIDSRIRGDPGLRETMQPIDFRGGNRAPKSV